MEQLTAQADQLRAEIANLDKSTDMSPAHQKTKAAKQQHLAAVEKQITKLRADRSRAEDIVGSDAKLRGRTAGEYLSGKYPGQRTPAGNEAQEFETRAEAESVCERTTDRVKPVRWPGEWWRESRRWQRTCLTG